MIKSFFTYLLLFVSVLMKGQDTIYLFDKWKMTREYANAYRVSEKVKDLYTVRDYFIDGQKKLTGSFLDSNFQIKNGEFKYYSKGGNLDSICHY